MSIIYSLLVFVLLFSFDACNARNLGAINKESASKFSLYTKNNENTSLAEKLEAAKKETDVLGGSYQPKAAGADSNERIGKRMKTEGSDNNGPIGSVTWRVPHEKERDQIPVFVIDYAPPETHPSIHN